MELMGLWHCQYLRVQLFSAFFVRVMWTIFYDRRTVFVGDWAAGGADASNQIRGLHGG
jgi:hypothetical protein